LFAQRVLYVCRRDPDDDRMLMRIIYCDWMPAEAWQLERGIDKTWFKPAASAD